MAQVALTLQDEIGEHSQAQWFLCSMTCDSEETEGSLFLFRCWPAAVCSSVANRINISSRVEEEISSSQTAPADAVLLLCSPTDSLDSLDGPLGADILGDIDDSSDAKSYRMNVFFIVGPNQ